MTMGRIRTDDLQKDARICFKILNFYKSSGEKIIPRSLQSSMGTSQDYNVALEEGSNWNSLGSVLFS